MKSFLFFFLIVSTSDGVAQNLIANPSFEAFSHCPTSFNANPLKQEIAPHWRSASYGTPDLFNTCHHNGQVGANNLCGFTQPFDGNGFSGIIAWEKNGFREYLIGDITTPLKKATTYKISFRYKLAQHSKYAVDQMGVYFSKTAIFQKTEHELSGIKAYMNKKAQAFTKETGTWELFELDFEATGDEKLIIIGNFSSNQQCSEFYLKFRKDVQPMLTEAAYYYIDAIQLISNDTLKATTPNAMRTFRFEHVNFKYNEAELLSESYNEIDSVANVLKRQPHFDITIIGHTDDSGSKAYNLSLSKARALAVKEYFISSGIAPDRVQIIGKGSSEPLSGTEAKVNRRVEFKLIEKNDSKI